MSYIYAVVVGFDQPFQGNRAKKKKKKRVRRESENTLNFFSYVQYSCNTQVLAISVLEILSVLF